MIDPDVYIAQITAILASYPEAVVHKVTNPVHGIPGRLKWLPRPAEVREACEREMEPMRREAERLSRLAETRRLLGNAQPDGPRSLAGQRDRLGEDWGIDRREEKPRTYKTPDELRASIGMSQSDWDAIPNAPREG